MEITRIDPEDLGAVEALVAIRNAVCAADAPWLHPMTVGMGVADLVHGWDGEPDTAYLGTDDGVPVAVGATFCPEWDNKHLGWVEVRVHPDHRRRGLGSELLEEMTAIVRAAGRTTFGTSSWDDEGFERFANRHGFERKATAINRRQVLADVDRDELRRQFEAASAESADYELVRRVGATPDDELDALAEMASAINDAPTDDLDIEDEVFNAQRLRMYEDAQAARGDTLYRVVARHRGTGQLAGHTVVAVEGERPTVGHQHDTSVVAAHRGHRLGLLLKADMNLWLAEAEPQLETIDTWNAESNDHMIGVNELLGYRILGRQLEYQKAE